MALAGGDVLGGYRIVGLVGRGGMGAVYLADDVRLGRKVALKVLSPEMAEQPQVRERFVRESKIAASLDHPHILPIYEAGEAEGQLFIAMRYVPGPDLAGIIERDGPLPLERTAALLDQVASALDTAHAAGLIHRDVKPGNILVAPGSQPGSDHAYLSDFGLTKHAEYSGQLTRSGQLIGSVGYVAPEQIEGQPIDARVDVYSLGCVLFECLAGAQPYPRETEMATLYAHVQAPPPSLAEARPELSATLDPVIARAMAKDPEVRYGSAGELARAVAEAARPGAAERHLTRGFLFADLRGYTAYVEAHGDRAGAQLLEAYRRLVRDVAQRFGGAEIKTEGDSFYLVFSSASDAVRCGLAIVGAAATSTLEHPDRPISVGIGVHAGETAETAEGYVGSAVNIAARVCAQAVAGEVLVTDTVRALTRTSSEVRFASRGRRRLKGIAEPVAVYAAGGAPAAGAPSTLPGGVRGAGGTAAFRRRRRLAVAGAAGVSLMVLAAALFLAGGLGAARNSSPGPTTSLAIRASSTPAAGSRGVGAAPTSSPASAGVIAWYQEFVDDLKGGPACVPTTYGFVETHVWVMPPDGSSAVRLMPESNVWEWSPAWAPDGSRLAFAASEQSSGGTLWTVTSSGEAAARLNTDGPDADYSGVQYARPAWSPDGTAIAFVAGATAVDSGFAVAGGSTLATVGADGSGKTLVRVDSTGSTKDTPAPGTTPAVGQLFDSPAWAPDGDLAFVVHGDTADAPGRVGLVRADGSGYRELPMSTLNVVSLAYSPDDARLALAVKDVDSTVKIWLANTDGTGLQELTDGPHDLHPSWSPDGREIAFASDRDGHFEIYRVGRDRTALTRLTTTPATVENCDPAWGATRGPMATPTPAASPGASSPPLAFHRGRLGAGTYVDRTFQPVLEFTLGPGWQGRRTYLDGAAIGRPELPRSELDIAKLQAVVEGGCAGPGMKTRVVASPGDVVNWLESNPHLAVSSPFAINLGGYSGLTVTVKVTKGCQGGPPSVFLFTIGEDSVSLNPGDQVEFICLDVRGSLIAVVSGGPKADGLMTLARPVVNSLTFPSP